MKSKNYAQNLRDKFIRELDNAKSPTEKAKELADDLFSLDLTVYSKNYSFNSIIYNSFAVSELDNNISMHPEQVEIISNIEKNDALIISAPTSFGKTFCIFEYIAKYKPQNIVLIVPTLALVEEYFKKIIQKYKDKFSIYKIHTNINEDLQYNFSNNNIFILTHDKVVKETSYQLIERIDFLVIDEVYKLEVDRENDRVLILNMAYYYLSKKAKKYVLLAPFIDNVVNIDKLEKSPIFYKSSYSPVVNDVKICEIIEESDRFEACKNILNNLNKNDKTLIYFPTVVDMYKYIDKYINKEPVLSELDEESMAFIEWAKSEIHEEWCVIKALERGYLIHNGQIPVGTRMFQLDCYEQSSIFNRMLCTSTLLEGVNTSAKNIIITKPSRKSSKIYDSFSAFDFFNLVGRTGRLHQHLIGNAYYIKSNADPIYIKEDAIKSIQFEITEKSKDIDIQIGNIDEHSDVVDFLITLGITKEEYLKNIGSRLRFNSVVSLYRRYQKEKNELIKELTELNKDVKRGRLNLIKKLYFICENEENKLNSNLINKLIHKNRYTIRSVVDDIIKYFKMDINLIIARAIRMKISYIEHTFYNKLIIIKYFMDKEHVSQGLIEILDKKVINPIESLYFSTAKHKKMLLDLGIYERDIDKVIKVIGDDFEDAFELKFRLRKNLNRLNNISYISLYVIKKII